MSPFRWGAEVTWTRRSTVKRAASFLVWAGAALTVVGAGGVHTRAAGQPSAPFDSIAYQDSGGFAGGGTGMSLSIGGDGKLQALARRGRASAGILSAEDLAALGAAVAAVDWPHIERTYRRAGAADLIVRDLVVVVHGTRYETHADSLAKLPPPLAAVFGRLDEFYGRAMKASRR